MAALDLADRLATVSAVPEKFGIKHRHDSKHNNFVKFQPMIFNKGLCFIDDLPQKNTNIMCFIGFPKPTKLKYDKHFIINPNLQFLLPFKDLSIRFNLALLQVDVLQPVLQRCRAELSGDQLRPL